MSRIIVIGLGPIGARTASAVRAADGLELVGLVDTDPEKVGRSLPELAGYDESPGAGEPPVAGDDLDAALRAVPEVAIVATGSRFDAVLPLVQTLVRRGVHVLTSCEELVWPWYRHAQAAGELDALARENKVAVLGAGVNPGFVLDTLPVVLSSMVRRVESVRGERRVEASLRRGPLQAKLGVGRSEADYREVAARRGGCEGSEVGHVGLAESLAMLAAGLGRDVEPGSIREMLEPVLAEAAVRWAGGVVGRGEVAGSHQTATWSGDGLKLELDLTMAVGLQDPEDVIELHGPVSFTCRVAGGVPGDSATVACLVNHACRLPAMRPGLRSMLDVPPAGCHNRGRLTASSRED